MRAISSIIALACVATLGLVSFASVGCGSSAHFNFEGSWLGHRSIYTIPGANPDVVTSLSQVKITIKSNGRFDMFKDGMPISGSVDISGAKATLNVTDTMDQELNRDQTAVRKLYPPFTLVSQSDGTLLFQDPKASDTSPVQLTRIATSR